MSGTVESPLVSVIIVNFNGLKFLGRCLSSLSRQSYWPFEVILVDNASTDSSIGYVRENFPSVRVIENKRNVGFAAGNNAGIMEAQGKLIATLNNDTEADPGWLQALVSEICCDGVGMCASKMLLMADPGKIDSAGIEISRSGASWDRGMLEPDDGRYNMPVEVFGPCAGAALYRKEMLDATGLFDEDFFAYMEDVDLAFRGQLAGWRCLYVPEAVIRHHHGGTAGYLSDFSIYYGNRNILWYALKNFPRSLLITSLPWIIGRNLLTIPYYALKGHGITIIRSKVDAILGAPVMLARRKKWPHERRISAMVKTWARFPPYK